MILGWLPPRQRTGFSTDNLTQYVIFYFFNQRDKLLKLNLKLKIYLIFLLFFFILLVFFIFLQSKFFLKTKNFFLEKLLKSVNFCLKNLFSQILNKCKGSDKSLSSQRQKENPCYIIVYIWQRYILYSRPFEQLPKQFANIDILSQI